MNWSLLVSRVIIFCNKADFGRFAFYFLGYYNGIFFDVFTEGLAFVLIWIVLFSL